MPTDVAMLDAMMQQAFRLGEVYGARAEQCEAEGNREVGLRWFELFDRAFFAFRVGLALKLRLAREARSVVREAEHERPERLETEPADGPERLEYVERDRDRDTERASFPLLLKTLNSLVTDAEAMPGPQPAELLDLKALLATVGAAPKAQTSKLRLAGSTATPLITLDRPKPRSGLSLSPRHATGPPRR